MQEAITTLNNALIISSMYILVALGFAFLFNMLGILNLAHGAIYMVSGYVCYALVVGMGMNGWLALLVTMAVLAAFGVFLEKFCFRPFVGDFNRLVMVCVAISVILVATANIMMGSSQRTIPTFAEGIFRAGPISVSYERIAIFSIAVVSLSAIVWLVSNTAWGRKMQAIAQNTQGALLQGINVQKTSAVASALGCALAALAGCLMGAYSRLGPFVGDFVLQKVLVVVILAGAGSLGGIFLVGLLLGTMDACLPVFLSGSMTDAISIIVVVLLLLLRPRGFFGHELDIPTDSQISESRSGSSRAAGKRWVRPVACAALAAVVAALPLLLDSPYIEHIIILAFIYIIASVSLRAITLSGQFPMAHAAYMGIGAYGSAMASKWLGWSPWVSMPLSALVTMGFGILIGIPFARLRTLYYAMGSLFFGIGIIQVIRAGGMWTGGYDGLGGLPELFTGSRLSYFYFFLALTIASIVALYRFEFSRIGRTLRAIAQSHEVASSVGINEAMYRVFSVGAGCFFVGLAGAGYAHYNLVVSPNSFDLSATLWLFMYVLIGGINTFAGPIIGTAILVLLPELLRDLKMYSPYISGGILLIVVYLMPGGLASLPGLLKSRSWAKNKMRESDYAPAE